MKAHCQILHLQKVSGCKFDICGQEAKFGGLEIYFHLAGESFGTSSTLFRTDDNN